MKIVDSSFYWHGLRFYDNVEVVEVSHGLCVYGSTSTSTINISSLQNYYQHEMMGSFYPHEVNIFLNKIWKHFSFFVESKFFTSKFCWENFYLSLFSSFHVTFLWLMVFYFHHQLDYLCQKCYIRILIPNTFNCV